MSAFPSTSMIASMLGLITTGTPYLALYTSNPTAGDSGTEVSGGGYARQAITFSSPSSGEVHNTNSMTFTTMPSATVTHYGVRDASTGGTLRAFGPLSSSVTTDAGDSITFSSSNVSITLTGS